MMLVGLLGRRSVTGHWQISLDGKMSGEGVCGPPIYRCILAEPSAAPLLPGFGESFQTLQVVPCIYRKSAADDEELYKELCKDLSVFLVLNGTGKASRTGDIGIVASTVGLCDSIITSTACLASSQMRNAFTSTNVAIPVAAGQIFQVKVVISFSAAPHLPVALPPSE